MIEFLELRMQTSQLIKALLIVGTLFIIIPFVITIPYQYGVIGIGVSLLVGTVIGFLAVSQLGWPLGSLVGLLGSMFFSPLLGILLGSAVSAYIGSIGGAIVGFFVGLWYEWPEKKDFEEEMSGLQD